MEKIFNAKTLDDAKSAAREFYGELGVQDYDINYEIIEQPVKKLFVTKGEFKIKAIVDDSVIESAKAAPPAKSVEIKAEKAPAEEKKSEDVKEAVITSGDDFSNVVNYLTNILNELGAKDFRIDVIDKEDGVVFDIVGEKLGIVIGRRGETLDSLQYLAVLANNRKKESYKRITVDCNGYRDKRAEILETLAVRTANKVLKQGRRITLEPMNPYERRIIHSKVADIEGVYSNSIGEEPYRKVVISANVPKRRSNSDGQGRNDRGDRGRNRNNSARSYKQSSGFQTSFERDYKRSNEPKENVEISQDTVDFEKSSSLGKIEL